METICIAEKNVGKNAIRRASRSKNGLKGAPVLEFVNQVMRRATAWLPAFMSVFLFIFAVQLSAQTPTPLMPPAPPEMEARLKKLETELRCLVCQNQTLAESPAGLAGDLRREIRLLADAGKSNQEIKQHLRERYGDFVLYSPPVDRKTWLLWFGPFALLFGGGGLLWWISRQRQVLATSAPAAVLSAHDAARAHALLDDEAAVAGGKILNADDEIRRVLKQARTIAVVGLSGNEAKPSFGVAKYLQAHGYRIIPVNPAPAWKDKQILGEKCYASLCEAADSIAEKIDIVDCFRKSADIPPIAEEAIAIGAKCLWMQLDIVNEAAAARAVAAGLEVVMNRCTLIEHRRLLLQA